MKLIYPLMIISQYKKMYLAFNENRCLALFTCSRSWYNNIRKLPRSRSRLRWCEVFGVYNKMNQRPNLILLSKNNPPKFDIFYNVKYWCLANNKIITFDIQSENNCKNHCYIEIYWCQATKLNLLIIQMNEDELLIHNIISHLPDVTKHPPAQPEGYGSGLYSVQI